MRNQNRNMFLISTSSERTIKLIKKVVTPKGVLQSLERMPSYLCDKFHRWVKYVEELGLFKMQQHPGFRDEALKGKRKGQRSVRLNRQYRVIYEIKKNREENFVEVTEVNKHEY